MMKTKKHAFTLAEVLVTLGIIGVVATLTLPNVMSGYAKKQQVAQLQRTVNALTSAAQNYMLEEQVDSFKDVDVRTFLQNYVNGEYLGEGLGTYLTDIYKTVSDPTFYSTILNVVGSFFKSAANSPNEWYCGKLDTGATVCITPAVYALDRRLVLVDTNAKGKPNTFGRDTFIMAMNTKGKVVPYTYLYETVVDEYGNETGLQGYEKAFDEIKDKCLENAINCYAQILNDGWQMNY